MNLMKSNLNYLVVSLLIIFSFLSYEKNIYRSSYQLITIFVLALGFFLVVINLRNKLLLNKFLKDCKKNRLIYILCMLLLITSFINNIRYSFINIGSILTIISMIISIYIFYIFIPIIIIPNYDKYIKSLVLLITFFSFISIIIYFNGSFLGYNATYYKRISSIFFDPNYFGTLAALGVILCYSIKKNVKFYFLINLLGVYYSGSRMAMIALLIVSIIFYFYRKKLTVKRIVAFFIMIGVIYLFINFLFNNDYFRVYQGLSSRDDLWNISFDLILKEPLYGYGYGSVGTLMKSEGAKNGSSHNSYLDQILMYGIPYFIIYFSITLKSLVRGVRSNVPKGIIQCSVFLLISANSISINIGGVGATSLLLTLFLGICNNSRNLSTYK